MGKRIRRYKISRTATKHIIVTARSEKEAEDLALRTHEDEWTDEGGDVEVEEVEE